MAHLLRESPGAAWGAGVRGHSTGKAGWGLLSPGFGSEFGPLPIGLNAWPPLHRSLQPAVGLEADAPVGAGVSLLPPDLPSPWG